MSLTLLLDPGWDEGLDELAAIQHGRAREFTAEARVLARFEATTTREDWQAEAPYDSLLLDVAGSCLIGQRSAGDRLDAAVHLVRQLPVLLVELDAGRVLLPQARVLIEETRHCSAAVCAEVESRIRSAAQTMAPGPLRQRVRALILAVDAEEAARRAAKASTDRGDSFRPIEDNQALLIAKGPALQPRALELALTARSAPTRVDLTPEPQHDPSAALAREVRLRDRGCDGPGCSQPAARCELDHHQRYPDGPTSLANLRPRSQRCHHAKHAGWTAISDPDGTSHWTSPAGRIYTVPTRDRPPPDIRGPRLPSATELAARAAGLLTAA